MMILDTTYMGLELTNPVIVGSSGLTGTFERVKECAHYSPGAIVLKSLYEEQILDSMKGLSAQKDALYWYPEVADNIGHLTKDQGADSYLKLIERCRNELSIPVIASINCISAESWPRFATEIESAGAYGVELNISIPPSDDTSSDDEIIARHVRIIREVKQNISIPVAVKLSPYFTNLSLTIKKIAAEGIQALVLFNRFFRTDVDIDTFRTVPGSFQSSPEEITLPLRWIALLSRQVTCDFAASTGVHDYTGIAKQLLVGASVVHVTTALYKHGPSYIVTLLDDFRKWMQRHDFGSLADFRGSITTHKKDLATFERVQFMSLSTTL